jgi:tetratricopeptide (TPR) repeat protein
VVEDIITGLSRIKWLFVTARNSSFTYKGRAADMKQVGRELGVRYLLEGSVRRAGQRVRITAQMIEAETGGHLWAERYDRSLDDIFALQDEITLSVIGAIEPSLREAEIERVQRKRPDSLDAYDLVLRALPHVIAAMPEDAARAVPLLERALALDADYAAAHGYLAWCHEILFVRGGLREENRAAAIRHARAAVASGRDDATALSLGAFGIAMVEHDRATAFDAFERALALSPSSSFALFSAAPRPRMRAKPSAPSTGRSARCASARSTGSPIIHSTRSRFRTSCADATRRRRMQDAAPCRRPPPSASPTSCWWRRSRGLDGWRKRKPSPRACSRCNRPSRRADSAPRSAFLPRWPPR